VIGLSTEKSKKDQKRFKRAEGECCLLPLELFLNQCACEECNNQCADHKPHHFFLPFFFSCFLGSGLS
jgi:hypothetical protein